MLDAYFTHRAARMPHLEDVAIDALDPFLRALLFTDGTVTRALEAHVLERVNVECVEQLMARVPEQTATFLEIDEGALALRRRVAITAADIPMVWAESFIVPERMPAGFAEMLDSAHRGMGSFFSERGSRACASFSRAELGHHHSGLRGDRAVDSPASIGSSRKTDLRC